MKQSIESYTSGVPVFQHVGLIVLPGGFKLGGVANYVAGTIIPAGTAFTVDEITRVATPVKSEKLYAAATNIATGYRVPKGTTFKTGDFITSNKGTKAVTVTTVDTTNASYDTINVDATIAIALNAGDGLYQANAAGTTSVLPIVGGLSYNDIKVETNRTLTIAVGGVFYLRRIPAISADSKALLPNIIFSNSR